jgi:hypothetical protein
MDRSSIDILVGSGGHATTVFVARLIASIRGRRAMRARTTPHVGGLRHCGTGSGQR